MQWNKRYFKVVGKLCSRRFKKNPHHFPILAMSTISFAMVIWAVVYSINTEKLYQKSSFTQWSQQQKLTAQDRFPASENTQHNCQQWHPELLDQEIGKLEAQYETKHFIKGQWYGVDLESLPSAQAQFLADNGRHIGDKSLSQNYNHCKDVICVLNEVYQDSTGESGKLVYYWYLKTGSMLNASNFIHGQDSKYPGSYQNNTYPLSAYLFSKDELQNFFILAKSLPNSFLKNPLLKTLYKIPDGADFEGQGAKTAECGVGLASGHLLLKKDCLSHNKKDFLKNIARHLSKYIDQSYAQDSNPRKKKLYSERKEWLDRSLWTKEEHWDKYAQKYQLIWHKHGQHSTDAVNPSDEFSTLLTEYRFEPQSFEQRADERTRELIKNVFFAGKSYTANGLFDQYFSQTTDQWSQQEPTIWNDCLDQHLRPELLQKGSRDLASSLEEPLYACVENKIPNFIHNSVSEIINDEIEGCEFFTDYDQYGHMATRYFETVDKFLNESVVKRKLELKNFGKEVLAGQQAKAEFIRKVDPASVYIRCFGEKSERERETCYTKTLQKRLDITLNSYREISKHYKERIREEILNVYPYLNVSSKTNAIAKNFIAPFSSQIKYAAKEIWKSCKRKGQNEEHKIKLPLKFTGNKNYVNAKLLNCINERIDDELEDIIDLGELKNTEKEYALSFMAKRMNQMLGNLLEEEVQLEENRFANYFEQKQKEVVDNFKSNPELLGSIYSFQQVGDSCLEHLQKHYPEDYFYHPKSKIDKEYGRKICSSIIQIPEINQRIEVAAKERWQDNVSWNLTQLSKYFENESTECLTNYPQSEDAANIRNSRMRRICIEEAFQIAFEETLNDWYDHKHYEYFSHREEELKRRLLREANDKISQADAQR